ncbi:MAG: hypothetical protein GEU26_18895 [Nitrososphaeraceae archaeon]|nr:hypothetical protein [Nitrososphaeraceae archaeon]
MKKNKMFNQKDIKAVLRYAVDDLPAIEKKFRSFANVVLDLEIKKKELSAQLIDLEHVINQYQNAIDIKKEKLSKMELSMSQLAIRCGKSKSGKDSYE